MTLHRLLGTRPDNAHPLPSPPRQPAAARRGRRRRVVDGLADDDGPAPRGGPPRRPAGPRRRPRPARLGRGRRRARRPRRGLRRRPRAAGRCASPTNFRSTERHPAARRGAADRRRRRRAGRAPRATPPRSSSSRPTTPAAALRSDAVAAALAVRAGTRRPATREGAVAALDEHRLLCAHREGPYGVRHWNRQIELWLGEATGTRCSTADGTSAGRCWSPPTTTALGSTTATTGVAVRPGEGGSAPGSPASEGCTDFATCRLDDVETMHAMTIHKSQGSQASEVTVLLPDGRLAAADPGALLHRGDPGQRQGAGRRHRGSRPRPRCARPRASGATGCWLPARRDRGWNPGPRGGAA